jgi:hypothetical protein
MKSTDIAMIVLIASVCVMLAYGVVGAIPGLKQPDQPVKVKTIELYSAQVDKVDSRIFGKDVINPTVDVTIGGGAASTGK